MALVVPRSYLRGENISAAILNPYWRDNFNLLHRITAHQTADVVKNNNDTLANLTGLAFPVLNGEEWLYGAHSFLVSSAVADAKWAVTAPSGSTGVYTLQGGAPAIGDAWTTTYGTALDAALNGTLEDNMMVLGYVNAGDDGTVQVQAAQNTATAIDTTFRKYSLLFAFRISTPNNDPIPSFSTGQALDGLDFETWLSTELAARKPQYGFLRESVEANQQTTPQDLPGMSFIVRPGETWRWFSFMQFSSNNTAHVAFAARAPRGSTGRYGVAGNGAPTLRGSTSTFGEAVAVTVPSNDNQSASFNGVIEATRHGRVQLQGCQRTSTAVDTTFYTESWFYAFRAA